MDLQKIILILVNLVGGAGVISSYIIGFSTHPNMVDRLWGKITPMIKSAYFISMPLAAIGYFLFAYFILFQLETKKVIVGNTFGYEIFSVIFAAILVPSALWMPLTFRMIENPSVGLWWAIRIVLFIVGLAALCLLCALLMTSTRQPAWSYWLAVAGSVLFFIQTGVMDAFVWPAYFPHQALLSK